MNTVRDQLDIFVTILEEFVNQRRRENKWPDNNKMSVELGRKYARIITSTPSRSVYCFVDLTNGDILKAATWKAPATRGKRGSIFDADDGMHCCDIFGLKYLV